MRIFVWTCSVRRCTSSLTRRVPSSIPTSPPTCLLILRPLALSLALHLGNETPLSLGLRLERFVSEHSDPQVKALLGALAPPSEPMHRFLSLSHLLFYDSTHFYPSHAAFLSTGWRAGELPRLPLLRRPISVTRKEQNWCSPASRLLTILRVAFRTGPETSFQSIQKWSRKERIKIRIGLVFVPSFLVLGATVQENVPHTRLGTTRGSDSTDRFSGKMGAYSMTLSRRSDAHGLKSQCREEQGTSCESVSRLAGRKEATATMLAQGAYHRRNAPGRSNEGAKQHCG